MDKVWLFHQDLPVNMDTVREPWLSSDPPPPPADKINLEYKIKFGNLYKEFEGGNSMFTLKGTFTKSYQSRQLAPLF